MDRFSCTYTGVTNIAGGMLSVSKRANGNANSSIGKSTNVATTVLGGPRFHRSRCRR